MKKLLFIITICVIAFKSQSATTNSTQNPYYYDQGKKVILEIKPGELMVIFNDKKNFEDAEKLLSPVMSSCKKIGEYDKYSPSNGIVLHLKQTDTTYSNKIKSTLLNIPEVAGVYNTFSLNGEELKTDNRIIFKLKNSEQKQEIIALLKSKNSEIMEQINLGDRSQQVAKISKTGNCFDIANKLVESGLVEFAQPNFTYTGTSDFVPSDQYYGSQWFLSQPNDADIDADEAWDQTHGVGNTEVAVIDGHGFDLSHPELAGKVYSPYDAVNDDLTPDPENSFANHGTPCAGLIAASTNNNTGTGVASVGFNIHVVPVMIGFNATSTGSFSTSDIIIAMAAVRIIQRNICAVSNSYTLGFTSPSTFDSYHQMRTQTRAGKGAVILASTGNNNQPNPIVYPASYDFGDGTFVIGVGASDQTDHRASFSNWGAIVDIMAPGVDIYTIDRSGSDGYSGNNYISNFTGTSAACPIVAGIVGLMNSVNPDYTAGQLLSHLLQTCDKVGGYSYSTDVIHTFSSWEQEAGYGRVNARSAVLAVITQPTLNATNLQTSNITCNTMRLNWTKGNGVRTLIVGRKGGPVNSFPVDGISYNSSYYFGVGSKIGADNYVIYDGEYPSADAYNLDQGVPYYFTAFEYNGSGVNCKYNLSPCSTYNITLQSPVTYDFFNRTAVYGNDMSFGKIVKAPNGNIFTAGAFTGTQNIGATSYTSNGDLDGFVAKINNIGTITNVYQIGGAGFDVITDIVADNSGFYITGEFSASITLGTITLNSTANRNFFIAKFNNTGNCIWAQCANTGASGGDGLCLNGSSSIVAIGHYVSTGTLGSMQITNHGGVDVFVAKFNKTNGSISWVKEFYTALEEKAQSIISDNNNNIWITGGTLGSITFNGINQINHGGADLFLAKYSSSGSELFSTLNGGPNDDSGLSLSLNKSSNKIIVSGWCQGTGTYSGISVTSNGGYDLLLAAYQGNGTISWAKNYGGINDDHIYNSICDSVGNIYTSGMITGLSAFGTYKLGYNGGTHDGILCKFNSSGNLKWAFSAGSSGSDYMSGINFSNDNKILITGFHAGPRANYGCNSYFTSTNVTSEAYIAKISDVNYPSCNYPNNLFANNITVSGAKLNWTTQPNSAGYRVRYTIAEGSTWTTVNVNSNTGNKILNNLQNGTQYEFQVSTKCDSINYSLYSPSAFFTTYSSKFEETVFDQESEIKLYPNPANSSTSIEIPESYIGGTLAIYSSKGKLVEKRQMSEEGKLNIDISSFANGLYMVLLSNAERSKTLKLIKQ